MKDGKNNQCKKCQDIVNKRNTKLARDKKRKEKNDLKKKEEELFILGKTKVCAKCGKVKSLNEFSDSKRYKFGKNSRCKSCRREDSRIYRQENTEKTREYSKNYDKNNRDKINERRRKHYKTNSKEILDKRNKYRKSEERKEYKRNYRKERYDNDSLYVLTDNVRSRTLTAFRQHGYTKKSKTTQLLGCEWKTLKQHIESQFTDGMSWENRDNWHIDHIIPLASATTEEELIKLCHHKNLQPLWAEDNISKSDSMPMLCVQYRIWKDIGKF